MKPGTRRPHGEGKEVPDSSNGSGAALCWSSLTAVAAGRGKVRELPRLLEQFQDVPRAAKVFVVTEKSVRDSGLLEYVLDSVKCGDLTATGVFDEVSGVAELQQSSEIARAASVAEADLWVAVGGGAAMDACKAAAVLHANGGTLRDYCLGNSKLAKSPAPIVCVPTTPGTGFEVTAGALLADRTDRSIRYLRDRRLAPALAVLDPEVTRTLPARYVVSSGLTALSHGVNALILAPEDPLSRCLAVRAIELVVSNLAEARDSNSTNETCRTEMLYAATMASMSLRGALPGLAGAVGQAVCTMQKFHFGLAIGIATLHVVKNLYARIPGALEGISSALGLRARTRNIGQLSAAIAERLEQLYSSVGVKSTYADYGFPAGADGSEELLQRSLASPSIGFCPGPLVLGPGEMKALLRSCVGG